MDIEFLANNLFVDIEKDIINLFSKQSIMDKINFLKCILLNFFKYLLSIFILCCCFYLRFV